MNGLLDWVADGRIINVMLGFVVLEVVMLTVLWRKRKIGIAPVPLLVNVLAGTCLMLSLRAVLLGLSTEIVAFWLVASLVAHVSDLAIRWNRT